ncbi:MAG TPA: PP2C family serine/threonine-protein phosphatase [Streptosporangiaceae bacterium]|nr:PP2C family serine/threonine-protein phosphatase [Streptosporangiaceae bacterium]
MPEAPARLIVRYAMKSDVGRSREENEDSAYAGPRLQAVADGLGGHAAGEVASATAIETLSPLDAEIAPGELLAALERAVRAADSRLHDMIGANQALAGMGTTLTALLWSGRQLALAHVGDSRAYLLRDGELTQISRDHTVVQALLDDGRITPEEALSHPQRSMVLRALGSPSAEPDLQLLEARAGDRYLLCSDGLYDVVPAAEISRVLAAAVTPEAGAAELVDLANAGGGPDNITCVIAEAVAAGPGDSDHEDTITAGLGPVPPDDTITAQWTSPPGGMRR